MPPGAGATVLQPQLAAAAVILCSGISHLSSSSHALSCSLPTHIGIVSVSVSSIKSVSAENDILSLTLLTNDLWQHIILAV